MRCEVCHSPYIIDESIEKIICEKNKENVELSIEIISSNNDNHNCHPICILVFFVRCCNPVWLLYWFVKANEDEKVVQNLCLVCQYILQLVVFSISIWNI